MSHLCAESDNETHSTFPPASKNLASGQRRSGDCRAFKWNATPKFSKERCGQIVTAGFASGWSNFRLEHIGSGKLVVRGREVLGILKRRGIRIPPTNRIQNAIKLTEKANRGEVLISPEDLQTAERMLEAFRTLLESFQIVWTLTERPRRPDPFPNERLEYLLRGADMPSEETNTKARNTQFELLVGSSLVMGGADVIADEPDYHLLFHGEYVGVAVKRLTSTRPSALRKALSDGADQIGCHTERGFIAVNLDSWITDLSPQKVEEVGQNFQRQLRDAYTQLESISYKEALLGVIIFGNWSRWRFGGEKPIIDWRAPTQLVGFGDTQEEIEKFSSFFEPLRTRYESSMANLGELV